MDHNNPHYIQHITDLGDSRKVVANEDIYLSSGNKLLARGNVITPDIYQRMIQHKLAKPIDHSIAIDNAISPHDLAEELKDRIKNNPLLSNMASDSQLENKLDEISEKSCLPDPLIIKLTILKSRMPGTFYHSIDVAIVSVFLGIKTGVSDNNLQTLFVSGLFHDIGMLHVDANIFSKAGSLSEEDRKSIYSHPVIGYLVVKAFPEHTEAARAILQHHEYRDGSGYPKGLGDKQLGSNGQLLAVAELAVSLQQQPLPLPYEHRLAAILKFNQSKYSEKGTQSLLKLFHDHFQEPDTPPVRMNSDEFQRLLSSVWSIIDDWERLHKKASNLPGEMLGYIDYQLATIRNALIRSGLSHGELDASNEYIAALLEKPCEIMAILNEAMYQLNGTFNELARRWPDITLDKNLITTVNDWIATARTLMGHEATDDTRVADFILDAAP